MMQRLEDELTEGSAPAGAHLVRPSSSQMVTKMVGKIASSSLVFADYEVFPEQRVVRRRGEDLPLGDRAFDILTLLAMRAGELVTKREMLEKVWPGLFVSEANLRAQIALLRAALGDDPNDPTYIVNVRGRGYVFTATVEKLDAPGPLSTSPTMNAPSARPLPRRSKRLLGREQALDDLALLIGAQPSVTVVGSGGVGKTALAVEVAHRLAIEFGGDVCFVDLAPLTAGDLVLPTVASALGYPVSTENVLTSILTHLEDRRVLLILDCCEHVLDEVCQLASALFVHASGVRVLATSRESLRSEGEHVYLLRSLELPRIKEAITADEASAAPAVQLFMERASSRGFIGTLDDANAPALAEICRLLDGNPLAIEMVSSRLGTYGFSGLLEALSQRSVLDWPGRRDDVRHQSLHSTLNWSYQLLTPQEQRVLARLSILSGPFSMADAQFIACLGDEQPLAHIVEGLADKSLLAMGTTQGLHFFRMLEVTRLYAGTKLDESGEKQVVANRHVEWCTNLLEDLYPLQPDSNCAERSSAAGAIGSIRQALEWCFSSEGNTEKGIVLAAHAATMMLDLSLHGECLRWCRTALSQVGTAEPITLPLLKLQEKLALTLMYTAGNHPQVGAAIEAGLNMAATLGERQTELHLLAGNNLYHTRRGDYPSALRAAERFAAIADGAVDTAEVVAADWMLGSTHHLMGDEVRGEELLERGFSLAQRSGRRAIRYFGFDHECRAAISRAWIAWLRGRPERSIACIDLALDTAAALNHPVTTCIAYLYLSWTALWLRDLGRAEELKDLLTAQAKRHQLKPYSTASVALEGELLLAHGRIEEAVKTLKGVLGSLGDDQQHIVLTPTLRAYADALARLGQVDLAEQIIVDLIHGAEHGAPTYLLPELIRTRGDVCLARGAKGAEDAQIHYHEAIAQARTNGALGWELRAATSLARLWIGSSRVREAHDLLRRTLANFTDGHGTGDLVEAWSLLGSTDAPAAVQCNSR